MSFPTPYTVGHHVATYTDDRFSNAVTYSPPKDQAGTPVAVIQIAAPRTVDDAGHLIGHDRAVVDLELYVLPGFTPGRGDLIDIADMGQFEVTGYPEDHNHGFHGWRPGSVVPLRRVEG